MSVLEGAGFCQSRTRKTLLLCLVLYKQNLFMFANFMNRSSVQTEAAASVFDVL